MFEGRSIEFFEAEHGRLSMSRLLCFVAYFPASYVVAVNPSSDNLAWYLGAFVGGYVGGKAAERLGKKEITTTTVGNPEHVSIEADNVNIADK